MKIISSTISRIIDHSLIFIVAILSYSIGMFVYEYALSVPMLLLGLVAPVAFIFFLSRPKAFIYFAIGYWPFNIMINKFFKFLPGSNPYYQANLLGVVFVLGTVIGIVILLLGRTHIFKYKLTVPMLLFFGTVIIGIFLSPLFFYAFRWIFRYGMPALLYFLILEKVDFDGAKRLLKLFSFSFIPVILFGYWMLITQSEKLAIYEAFENTGEAVYRLGMMEGGSGFHPNSLGLHLAMFAVFYIFFFFESRIKYRWIYVLLIINSMVLLFHTYSRMGWVCFLAGICVVGLLKSRKLLIAFLLGGALILATVPFLTRQITLRFEERGAVESRFKNFEVAWDLFLQKPILGHGQGSYQIITASRLKEGLRQRMQYGVGGTMAHNEYLRILAESGVVGIGIFLFLMYRFLKLSVQIFKLPHPTAKNYGAFLIAAVVMSLLSGFPGEGYQSTNFYLWTFFAIGEIFLRELQSLQYA